MRKFLSRILYLVFTVQDSLIRFRYRKNLGRTFKNKDSKVVISATDRLVLKAETEKKLAQAEQNISDIVSSCNRNSQKLIDYIKASETKVFVNPHAQKLLKIIGEDAGFITDLRGLQAFYLNLILGNGYSFKSEPLFVFEEDVPDFYALVYQFYKWYCYKSDVVGYDYNSQKNLKKFLKIPNSDELLRLSIQDNLALQEAIKRDREAAEFTAKIIRQTEGAKNVQQKLSDGGAEI